MATPERPAARLGPTFDSVGVKNQTVHQEAGVSLSDHQKVLVGSVLDVREAITRLCPPPCLE